MDGFIQGQRQDMFELDDDEAYAGTEADVWHAIRAFNNCEVVGLNELTPEERTCLVCKLPFDDPEEGEEVLHIPVRLPCSHVMGKECLAKRTTPFGAWQDNWNSEWEERRGWFDSPRSPRVMFSGSADCPVHCPVCRQDFFQEPLLAESALGLEARLMLWDRAYARVGCLRSEREEQSRADLIRYVEFNRLANGDFVENQQIDFDQRWGELQRYHSSAMGRLFDFVLRRANYMMTPVPGLVWLNLKLISLRGIDTVLDDLTSRAAREEVYGALGLGSDSDHDMGDHESDMEDVADDEEGSGIESDDTHVEDGSDDISRDSDHTHVEDNDRDMEDDGDDDTNNANEGEIQAQGTQSYLGRATIILRELDRVGK
ncbi:hypothetical protein MMC29_002304 [Sticta canariensis]|nr:hypothetical protein [Sticta canariensis]